MLYQLIPKPPTEKKKKSVKHETLIKFSGKNCFTQQWVNYVTKLNENELTVKEYLECNFPKNFYEGSL